MNPLFIILILVALLSSCNIREVEIGNIEGVSIKNITKEQTDVGNKN